MIRIVVVAASSPEDAIDQARRLDLTPTGAVRRNTAGTYRSRHYDVAVMS